MDPKELKEIDKFLTLTGAVDLFAYMGLPATADADMADLAIRIGGSGRRRSRRTRSTATRRCG